jgi:hypothetical protein
MIQNKILILLISLLLLIITSCTIGRNIAESELALNPNGSDVVITFAENGDLTGELLAVDSTSVTVLVKEIGENYAGTGQTVQTPYIAEIQFAETKNITASHDRERIVRNGKLNGDDYEKFAYLSRFPQGISPELMDNLLGAYDQDEIIRFDND